MDTTINTPLAKTEVQKKASRKDVLALWLGIAFSLVFTGVIWLTGDALKVFPHLPQRGPLWYFWKLPAPTLGGEITAWGLYMLHQLTFWVLIWYAQTHVKKYTTGLHRINAIALGANALFVLLHFVQTHIWYDGLAQNVSVLTSQGSVIVLLVWVLLMENSRRGMFFGQKLPISQRVIRFARKYHAYYFSWAIVYTFWYHPMENTWGHLVGFFYMFLLMLQGSLFLTRIHTNKYWTFTLELLVLAHGTMVALMQGNDLWPMFFFGFGGIFIITQMHGLNLSRGYRWGFLLLYIAGVALVYGVQLSKVAQISYIPLIDYPAVIVLALLIGLGIRVTDWLRPKEQHAKATS
jgi:hypothetical protein